MSLYPLKFKPRYLEKMWGGRKIETVLGKKLPTSKPTGESWELFDFPPGVIDAGGPVGSGATASGASGSAAGDSAGGGPTASGASQWVSAAITNGPLAGKTLHEIVQTFGRDLYGDVPLVGPHGQFPILIKFLDAEQDLSVQVHPDRAYASTHADAHLKSEAWYIVQSDPGARLLKGLKPGTTRKAFAQAVKDGSVESLIHAIPVKEGECFYLPSGTVHALGAGILAAEVQTPSDTTYRVHDFNRVDPSTGKLRKLHVEQAMQCIDFSGTEPAAQTVKHLAGFTASVKQLVGCEFFTIKRINFSAGAEEPIPYDQPVVWIILQGNGQIDVAGMKEAVDFTRGDTLLLPAKMNHPVLKTSSDCTWLEVTFPTHHTGEKSA
jgi:mannose-6-phosphate isomerase